LPTFEAALDGRIFLDLLNEPDAVGLTWAGSKAGGSATLGDYYLAAMEKIEQQTPGLALFFVQGGGQGALGVSWGDGFATDKALVQKLQMADASPFLQQLLQKPYGERTILAPHAYGPTVTQNPEVGPQQWKAYNASWSHLQRGDFCSNGTAAVAASCFKFPVVLGEMGSLLKDTGDQQFFANVAKYMKAEPPTAAFKPVAFNSWFW
jgi:aryl-phospho-beta-D-glucosidase BglC (GH1 family)